jgi:hypothetical protein
MSEPATARAKELDRADKAIALIIREFAQATSMNGSFHSAHEGYAVILEELDELKEEVWKKARDRDPEALVKEAVQVGAMAMRFLVDVALPEREP